jgi:hypothetical protein
MAAMAVDVLTETVGANPLRDPSQQMLISTLAPLTALNSRARYWQTLMPGLGRLR